MTYEDENRNSNEPEARRRPAERMNDVSVGSDAQDRSDFQDHLTKRADAGRARQQEGGSSVIDRDKFRAQLEGLSDDRRATVLSTAEDLVRNSEQSDEQAVLNALREQTDRPRQKTEEEIESPDVSLEHPHGPEGASHGGRSGRDPLEYIEDSTPSGANAFSSTRGGPGERRKRQD
jgi:hypothetical protein